MSKCIATGLVGGEGFSIDASLIKADAGRKQRVPGDEPIAWPQAEEASRAVREYLAALDAADHDEEIGGDDDGSSRGGKRRKPPKQVSLTDPQAAWVARKNTDPFFAYDANYLIDNKAGIIVDAEGTRANRIAEIAVTATMIERVKDRFDLQPRRLAGDTVYGAVRLASTRFCPSRPASASPFRGEFARHAPTAPSHWPRPVEKWRSRSTSVGPIMPSDALSAERHS